MCHILAPAQNIAGTDMQGISVISPHFVVITNY